MSRTAMWLLTAGLALFVALLASQEFSAVMATLSVAGWGLLWVAMFHLLPVWIDAAAIRVLCGPARRGGGMRDTLLARFAGESANSLLPAGQIGGPVLMARHLSQRGMPMQRAAAIITVSTTMQTFAQIAFAIFGVSIVGTSAGHLSIEALRNSALIASAVLGAQAIGFYFMQRRGLFSKAMRAARFFAGKRDWSRWLDHAESIDEAVLDVYRKPGPVLLSFALSLLGWVVGTGEVYIVMALLGHPIGWAAAFVLESLGQAIRGAAFAIPGALGIQEGGYLLLAPLAGLSPGAALALSLAKRTREILLGVPGLIYLHLHERAVPSPARAEP